MSGARGPRVTECSQQCHEGQQVDSYGHSDGVRGTCIHHAARWLKTALTRLRTRHEDDDLEVGEYLMFNFGPSGQVAEADFMIQVCWWTCSEKMFLSLVVSKSVRTKIKL